MSSQIYSRWVPLPKQKNETKVNPAKIEQRLEKATPASFTTKPDASATYSRYTPTKKTVVRTHASADKDLGQISVQKRKREDKDTVFPKKLKLKETEETDQEKEFKSTYTASLGSRPKAKRTKSKSTNQASVSENIADRPAEGFALVHRKKEKRKARNNDSKNEDVLERGEATDESAIEAADSQSMAERKSNKSKKPETNAQDGLPQSEEDHDDKKHVRLMKKREKSLKKAGALTWDGDSLEPLEEPQEVHDLVPLPQPLPSASLPPLAEAEALPSWMTSPIRISATSTAKFKDLGLSEQVCAALGKVGYESAFAIQAALLPILLPGHECGDVLVSAATGSGKTLAYVLPMIEKLSHACTTKLRGVIVMPTRELVMQAKIVADICSTAFHTDHKRVIIGTAVGSENLAVEQSKLICQHPIYDPVKCNAIMERQDRKWDDSCFESEFNPLFREEPISELPQHILEFSSKIDVLICTPGRLVEHIKSTPGFTLKHCSMLVVDEADKLLDQSFQQWVQVILAALGPRKTRQNVTKVIMSATMTRDVGQLSQLKLYRPRFVELEGAVLDEGKDTVHALPKDLLEFGVKIEDESVKPLYLMELLRRQNLIPNGSANEELSDQSESSDTSDSSDEEAVQSSKALPSSNSPRGVLIFTKSNDSAVRLSRLIALLAPSAALYIGTLTSTLPRASRERTIRSFSTGSVSILVASDLVSRGLDLPLLGHVINYDVPTSLKTYIHRVGRTARAGNTGYAWTFFSESDGRWFWNEVARVSTVQRGKKVERLNIYKEKFTEEKRSSYDDALSQLSREASLKS